MPRRRQPTSLEDLAIKATVIWLCKIGRRLMVKITKLAKLQAIKGTEDLRTQVQSLHDLFEYNVPCYLYGKLCREVFSAVSALLDDIKRELRVHSSMGEFINHCNVAIALTEVIISPYLEKLDFEELPKMMRQLFYTKLKQLPGLRYLNLCSLSGGWKTHDMEPIVLNGIVGMRNLHTLVLNYDCTDNILQELGRYCPRLNTLDISSSKLISNNSVKYLLDLNYLKNLQLYRTSVTIEGYVRLLMKLPMLEDIGKFDEIGRCLEYIDMTYENFDDKPILRLKTFTSRFVITKHLQILSEMCPELTTVCLFHNPLLNDLMALIPINKLSVLKLLSCDFFSDQLRDVLAVKGCNLTHLHFEHVDQIDMNALMYVSQFCPELKTLTFYNCELLESTSLYTRKLDIPPFMNLERLTIAAVCHIRHMEFLLANCHRIKFIHIGTMAPTSDALFQTVLSRNAMEYLEELRIIFSEGLSINTAYLLTEVCQNLAVLNELESWTLIREYELETFKIHLRTRNIGLDIKPLRRFNTEEEDV